MQITIITLFPELFLPFLSSSILGRAAKKSLVEYRLLNIRNFGEGRHQVVDGRPFGGGPGMVLKADILAKAWKKAAGRERKNKSIKTILMSTSGPVFKQAKAKEYSLLKNLIIVCGHYEGVDQRFIDHYVDEEVSVGDFVLTGGELPALIITDAIVRLLPGVLKKEEATLEESFSLSLKGRLEYSQYTRPEVFEGETVPQVLVSGNHQEIAKWREDQSLQRTLKVRPDLLA
ncbi:MAG: tRNA (guanosine(37)-N1)-methyltransferase TrmD [bacterium]|nr:tRNA (guanosine(37)-N1)-methyltransferase TrmD [bacterium]